MLDKIIKNKKNYTNEIIEKLKNSKKKLIVYGAGIYSYVLIKYLKAKRIKIFKIVVDEKYKHSEILLDTEIIFVNDILDNINDYNIVVGFPNYPLAIKKLKKYGGKNLFVIDVPDFLNIPKTFMEYSFIIENKENFEKAYNCFEDKLSKKTFIGAINTKLSGDLSYIKKNIQLDHLYFTKKNFPKKKNEILLDVGGFNGDSIKDFHSIANGNYDHIISLEPFPKMFNELKKTINNLQINDRCTPIQIGAWNKKDILSFSNTEKDIDSKIELHGDDKINVNTIDSILSRTNHSVSYIKIDINGAEYNALKGASEIISKNKPFIAVKMHVKQDFFRLPILLKKIAPKIKLQLRQRNYMSMMLVLYAFFDE
ncbi:FkbM family methyltransferase [Candidatus Pelagibacter sp.]|uniref:FkbM family methyltransferase n=1 Tax=Candidatus Pelagibacter sp. TaxID=2024849 RepID=UPI003F86655C